MNDEQVEFLEASIRMLDASTSTYLERISESIDRLPDYTGPLMRIAEELSLIRETMQMNRKDALQKELEEGECVMAAFHSI